MWKPRRRTPWADQPGVAAIASCLVPRLAPCFALGLVFVVSCLGMGNVIADAPTDLAKGPENGAEKGPAESGSAGRRSAAALRSEGFVPLFTGQDLGRWKVEQGHQGHWVVRDGVLNYDGKAEQKKSFDKSLWTRDSFGESEFYIEWRLAAEPRLKEHPIVLWNGDFLRDEKGARITRPHLDAGDSGIYFRGHFECQANIWSQELGSGEINGYRTNRKLPVKLRQSCLPFKYADHPLGQWNVFWVRLKEGRMMVNLNGQDVLHSEPLPGLPASGPIGLQHHGDPIQFRNIWVRELAANE